MTPNDTADPRWDRLIHLVAGELSADEAAELRQWAEAATDRQEALARLEAIWLATGPVAEAQTGDWDAEAEIARIREVTGGRGQVIARVGPNFEVGVRRSWAGRALRVAAMIAVVAGAGFLWRRATVTRASQVVVAPMAEYRTAPGERLSLRLPDGTTVLLAPGGVLRRPVTYGGYDRTVYLEGEAYFDVTHDATRPFAVHTAHAIARDLGTKFVVRAYAGEVTDVVVAEGVVAVGRGRDGLTPLQALTTDSVVLGAAEGASVTATGAIARTAHVTLDRALDWTTGRLVFEDTPLRDVARRLERWYGIRVQLADTTLGNRKLVAAIREESAAQALDIVATSLDLTVSRSDSTYVLGRARP